MSFGYAWIARSSEADKSFGRGVPQIFSQEQQRHFPQRAQIIELYDELRPSLYSYLLCLGLLPQQADDVIQDAFLRLFAFLESGGRVENLRSWIFRVAHNLSLNLQKRERRLVADAAVGESAAGAGGASLSPEDLYLHKERSERLGQAITQLSDRQRQCLYLRAEGLRYREIAVILGITTSGVAESLKRSIIRLLRVLYE